MQIGKILLSSAFVAITTVAFSSVSAMQIGAPVGQVQDFELQQQLQQIERLARAKGVVLQGLQVHQSMQLSANSAGQVTPQTEGAGRSCTVTARIVVAGVGATISATAPTCREAAKMIADYVGSVMQ